MSDGDDSDEEKSVGRGRDVANWMWLRFDGVKLICVLELFCVAFSLPLSPQADASVGSSATQSDPGMHLNCCSIKLLASRH